MTDNRIIPIILIILVFIVLAFFAYSGFFNAAPRIQLPAVEKSGITGTAMLGPICPVIKNPPDPKCADRPYKTNLIANSATDSTFSKKFSSGDDGRFTVDLPAGNYTISSSDNASFFSRCSSQGEITVEKKSYTNITLSCDTGIR